MKKASLTSAFVLVLAIALVAQTSTPTQTQTTTPGTTQTSTENNPTSLTGCLSGPTNGVYTLRTLTDNKVYTLRSNTPLSSHANRAVTVTGSLEGSATTSVSGTSTMGTAGTSRTTTPNTATGTSATTPGASGSAGAAGTGAATGAGNAQMSTTAAANAPVFVVTSFAMANESCEAGSSAVGTGASTTSTTGQTSATGQTSTTGSATGMSARTGTSTSGTSTASQTTGTTTTASGAYGTTGQTGTRSTTAQTGTTTGSGQYGTTSQTTTPSGGREVLTGCLMASNDNAGRFFLRTTTGHKMQTEIIPDAVLAANINQHVGHRVRLTGTYTDSATATTGSATGSDTMAANRSNLPQSDAPSGSGERPDKGKKAHEQDMMASRAFTASTLEHVSESGCPQSSTTPNSDKARKSRSKTHTDHKDKNQ